MYESKVMLIYCIKQVPIYGLNRKNPRHNEVSFMNCM